jgi:hypothetical protein
MVTLRKVPGSLPAVQICHKQIVGGECSASRPGCSSAKDRDPGIRRMRVVWSLTPAV